METRHVIHKSAQIMEYMDISGMRQRTEVLNTPNWAERHRGLTYMGQIEICQQRRKWAAKNGIFA